MLKFHKSQEQNQEVEEEQIVAHHFQGMEAIEKEDLAVEIKKVETLKKE